MAHTARDEHMWTNKRRLRLPAPALLIGRVNGTAKALLTRVAPNVALQAVTPSTISQLPGGGRATLHQLAPQVPSYLLEVGPGVSQLAALIRRAINGEAPNEG